MAYLNRALTNFRNEINSRWPNRDKASDGWIGDAAHQANKSDHNPDPDGSVDAIDIDIDGIDVTAVLAAAIHHEATSYVIYNKQITSRQYGLGYWRPYYGASPHTEHIHVSTRDAYETSNAPWFPVTTPTTPIPDNWTQRMIDNLPTIRQGSTESGHVRTIQTTLCARGIPTVMDSDFGDATRRNVATLQTRVGLEPDGIVGPKTWAILLTTKHLR